MDLIAFFSTFEPKDWVTSALALVAIIIAVPSGIATIANLRNQPRTALVGKWRFEQQASHRFESRPAAILTVVNEGSGKVIDLEWKLRSPQRDWFALRTAHPKPTLGYKDEDELQVSLADGSMASESVNDESVALKGVAGIGVYKLRASWREEPQTEKPRSKTFRFRVRRADSISWLAEEPM